MVCMRDRSGSKVSLFLYCSTATLSKSSRADSSSDDPLLHISLIVFELIWLYYSDQLLSILSAEMDQNPIHQLDHVY